ncbi:pre-mRNA 3-end-processing factor fip1l1 [Boothiomyces sp. JEL0838]|nr:pre-mRNA 3-end-processing factor fip1l1 [Boothiomyces sp. JEL0838]
MSNLDDELDEDLYGKEEEEEVEDEDSESDIEIVVDQDAQETKETEKPKETSKPVVGLPIPKHDSTVVSTVQKAGLDIEAMGQYEGVDIINVDMESFEDKPWRNPGADITDYFNFGFNEATWKAYCTKQRLLREGQKKVSLDLCKDKESDLEFESHIFSNQYREESYSGKYQRSDRKESSHGSSKRHRDDDAIQVLGGYDDDNESTDTNYKSYKDRRDSPYEDDREKSKKDRRRSRDDRDDRDRDDRYDRRDRDDRRDKRKKLDKDRDDRRYDYDRKDKDRRLKKTNNKTIGAYIV